jgi:xanthine dehydrogenase accessory factor
VLSSADLRQALAQQASVLVTVHETQGSTPREVGAWMLVQANQVLGTVGGGHLELQAIAHARSLLADTARQGAPDVQRYPLGPSLGQCCGGVVHLQFMHIHKDDAIKIEAACAVNTWTSSQNSLKIALFGGGHVGKALVQVLGTLPCQVRWVDSRDEIFPTNVADNVQCEHSAPVHAAVNDVAAGSHVLIMSFSHAEDLDVVAACLARLRTANDLGFIGLIGSASKWAVFRHRLEQRGFAADEIARITCPIGLPKIQGKEPEVIAISVAAQLLALRRPNAKSGPESWAALIAESPLA